MRIVIASFVLSLAIPVLHAQGTNALNQANSPYTLVTEQKTVQTLADGTQLTRTVRETFLRDTLGRIRTEQIFDRTTGGASIHMIVVQDTVAGRMFNWAESPGDMSKEYYVHDYLPIVPVSHILDPPPVRNKTSVSQTSDSYHVIQEVKAPAMPQMHQEDLGTKDIQGFICKASRETTVFPPGFFGNDRPITTINEHCFSQELQRDLEATRVEPLNGTTTLTVVTLNRSEPDASLFRPPPDYTERAER